MMSFDETIAEGFRRAVEEGLPNYAIRWKGKPFGVVSFIKKKYYVHRERSKHFMRVYQGYGVSKLILEQLRLHGIQVVSLFEQDGKSVKRYEIPVENFFNHKPLLERVNTISPFEKQLFAPLSDFKLKKESA